MVGGVLLRSAVLVAQEPQIFREISIQPFGAITLGEVFSQRDSLGDQLAENVFLLPAGFGGTAGIAVVLDRSDQVVALVFEYTSAANLSEMVAEYRQLLGRPRLDQRDGAEACVLWEDAVTRFEIFEGPFKDQRVVASMMIDRAAMTLSNACALEDFIELGIGQSGGGGG